MRGGKLYDVVILGAGLSGLLAAALLAKRGRHVLVVEEEATPGGLSHRVVRESFSFTRGPDLFLGFERDGLYNRLFMELGLSLSMLKKEGTLFQRSNPPFQLILPDHRLNFYLDPAELLHELGREFPDHIQGIRLLFSEVDRWDEILRPAFHLFPRRPARGWGEWVDRFYEQMRLKSAVRVPQSEKALAFLKPFGLDPEFCRGLSLLLLLFTGRTLSEATGLDLLSVLGLLRREVVALRGGIPRLAEWLIKVIQEYHGDVILSQPLEGWVVHRRRLTAVRIKEGEVLVTGRVIANVPFSRLPHAEERRPYFSLYFRVASEALPSAMSEHLLMTPNLNKPPFSDNFLFLIVSELEDPEATPRGQRAIQVITCLSEFREPTPEEVERLRDSFLVQLAHLMPFSNASLAFIGYDLWTGREEGRLSVLDAPLLSRAKARGRNGATYYTLPIRNLFLLPDHGHQPAAGLEQARSAIELVERIEYLERK